MGNRDKNMDDFNERVRSVCPERFQEILDFLKMAKKPYARDSDEHFKDEWTMKGEYRKLIQNMGYTVGGFYQYGPDELPDRKNGIRAGKALSGRKFKSVEKSVEDLASVLHIFGTCLGFSGAKVNELYFNAKEAGTYDSVVSMVDEMQALLENPS